MLKMQEQFITNKLGKKMAVVLSFKNYQELLEDIHDLSIIAERKDESTISFTELKKRLKTDGLI